MSQWLSDAISRAEDVQDWLTPRRHHALTLLKSSAWPTRKTEAWKYTPLRPLAQATFSAIPANDGPVPEALPGVETIDVPFVDGQLQVDMVTLEALPGVSIRSLRDAAADGAADCFAQVKPERHLFGLVNDVLATEGVVIDIEPGARIERPIRLVHEMRRETEGHLRCIVRVGRGASVSVIEQLLGEAASFNTFVTEFDVKEQAQLEHYRFMMQTGKAMSVGGDHIRLASEARLNSTVVGFGSDLSRLDLDVFHVGENAHAAINAVYLLNHKELFDLHSNIEHQVPSCQTEEKVRGIVAGASRAVFNGRIHIHRYAQKTVAELNNLNLLMSRDAEVDTKPELEIYADDVRCAHGATVAEIDKKSLYYLQSRGISRTEAQVMLSFGFVNELVNEMPNKALGEWLRPLLRDRFASMQVV